MKELFNIAKRITSLCLVALILGSFVTFVSAEETLELNVCNWGEYIDTGDGGGAEECKYSGDVIKKFEEYYQKQYGKKITVNYSGFENNEDLYTKISSGAADYDVVIPSDYMINRFIKEGMLEPLNFDNIPNYQYIDNQFKGDAWNYDPEHKYTVPYLWGTVGIVYNSKYVIGDKSTWDILFPEEDSEEAKLYKGKILMFNNPRDTFAIALSKLSTDKNNPSITINTNDLSHWEEAYELLKKQKPYLQGYVTDEVFNKMENEEAWIAPCYYGDAKSMISNNPDLEFAPINNSVANKYVDAMCIPKGAKHKDLAEIFINFMCTKEIAYANACYTGYSTPHTEVMNDPEFVKDPNAYPEAHRKYEEFKWLNPETQAKMDELWADLRKLELGDFKYYIYIGIGVVLIAIVIIIILRARNKKNNDLYDDEDTVKLSKKERKAEQEKKDYNPIVKDEDKLE